jgi:UDP-N-acetylmuramoyl-L-alanyl-D-glutamate--2,6-diaminopimelate ligase
MKLMDLINATQSMAGGCDPKGLTGNPEITAVFCRAQEVTPGSLFVAIKGFTADGHDYIAQAIEKGAVAVVCEGPGQAGAVMVTVPDSRKAMAEVAAAFYGHPSADLTVIGITGTNGKTTTSYLIERVLQQAKMATGVIGTINYRFAGQLFDNPVTTPESLDLQRILARMRDSGVTHVVMEVSSHALDLHRVHGCLFDVAVFTNFSQDHLDYHKDMGHYWACKRRLFTELLPSGTQKTPWQAVINMADPKGLDLVDEISLPYIACGQGGQNGVQLLSARFDMHGIRARIDTPKGVLAIHSPLVGRHNLENILNAVGVGVALDMDLTDIAEGIDALDHVPGRLERVPGDHRRFVYVDYAHTPDALENALLALRALTVERIICVFGCGGDRDRAKRSQMGAIAARLSDLALVTSDNPRTEPPDQIIDEIVAGVRQVCDQHYAAETLARSFQGKGYAVVPDRREAIQLSIQVSRPGDTILIAGKGHEPYQVVGRQKLVFDDRQEAQAALAGL